MHKPRAHFWHPSSGKLFWIWENSKYLCGIIWNSKENHFLESPVVLSILWSDSFEMALVKQILPFRCQMLGSCEIWVPKDEWQWGEWQVWGGEVHEDSGQLEGHPGVDTGLLGMVHQEQEGRLQDGKMLDQSHQEGIKWLLRKKLSSDVSLSQVRIEQKLVLFYLVNDIVQHSAKRNYGELLDKFRSGIKEAMPHLKVVEWNWNGNDEDYYQIFSIIPFQEEKIGPKVQRCLDIWEEREVFDSDFIQVRKLF